MVTDVSSIAQSRAINKSVEKLAGVLLFQFLLMDPVLYGAQFILNGIFSVQVTFYSLVVVELFMRVVVLLACYSSLIALRNILSSRTAEKLFFISISFFCLCLASQMVDTALILFSLDDFSRLNVAIFCQLIFWVSAIAHCIFLFLSMRSILLPHTKRLFVGLAILRGMFFIAVIAHICLLYATSIGNEFAVTAFERLVLEWPLFELLYFF
jgi:hypothetical protein